MAHKVSSRKVTTSIVIRLDLLAELDRVAVTLERSRSFLVQKAVQEYLDRRESGIGLTVVEWDSAAGASIVR